MIPPAEQKLTQLRQFLGGHSKALQPLFAGVLGFFKVFFRHPMIFRVEQNLTQLRQILR